ncbi:MAG TPA: glutathione peroxidase [Oligoflexia bacterium]|nr:glutathione peroxidase [Oligoflexia bacterium]HMR25703.1 glutathione peroxidase [Oligoflexia bacterium]
MNLSLLPNKCYLCILTVALINFQTLNSTLQATEKGKTMLLDQKTTLLDGKSIDLSVYAGKVILFVNTASYCGYTPQYKELQKLHERYEKQGFTVIAIPCNNFGNQEPGKPNEIKQFLQENNYAITFPILSKRDALGNEKNTLFQYLTELAPKDGKSLDVQWNFEKFLVNRKQEVVARFRSSVNPLDNEVIAAIEKALQEKP